MQAIAIKEFGDIEQLQFEEISAPSFGYREVLVKTHATALNRADILQRKGLYPPPPGESNIPGLEVAGEIVGLGKDVKNWQVGDRVMALLAGGGYAEYVKIPEQLLMPIPENFSYENAAAIPEAFLTAWQALFLLAKLSPDERVLIHAGASGVGSAAIQLAKLKRTEVIVTASGSKLDFCRELGADVGLDYKAGDFKQVLIEHARNGFNVIIDFVGAPYFDLNIQALGLDGRMVLLGLMGGVKLPSINISPILYKRLTLKGSTLRARSLSYKTKLVGDFVKNGLPKFKNDQLKPIVDTVFDWKEVQAAHRYMESNKNKGKIVLMVRH